AAARARLKWRETNYLVLRRGPYLIAAGLEESIPGDSQILRGRFVNLFDPKLEVCDSVTLTPGSRFLLLDLGSTNGSRSKILASACRALPASGARDSLSSWVEGVAQ